MAKMRLFFVAFIAFSSARIEDSRVRWSVCPVALAVVCASAPYLICPCQDRQRLR